MKTVLHVIDTTGPGGAEVVFIELADKLRQQGYRCVPVVRGPGWVMDTLRERGLEPIELAAKGSFNFRYLRNLVRIIRAERVDLIQAHLLGSSVYCAIAGLLTRKPVVATFHGMVDVSRSERFVWLKRLALRRGVSTFVTVSKSLANSLEADGLLESGRCKVIFNGIDTSRFARSRSGWLRSKLKLPSSARISLSIGNVRPAKAYDDLCRAAAKLRESCSDLHFVIAGDPKPSLMKTLQILQRQLHIEDRMHFIGFHADPALLLPEADVFVLSSVAEGFSLATVEALAAALPAVVTACGGPEEIVVAGASALVCPPGDPDALAEAIAKVLTDKKLAEKLGEAGQRASRLQFDVAQMIKSYDETYRELTNAHG